MRFSWVNTLLLVLLAGALVTGYLGLTNGHASRAWIFWLHATAAYSIVSISAWKAAVVRRSLQRHPIPPNDRSVFLVLTGLLVFVLVSGILWAWTARSSSPGRA